jgi:hypothetical protein
MWETLESGILSCRERQKGFQANFPSISKGAKATLKVQRINTLGTNE